MVKTIAIPVFFILSLPVANEKEIGPEGFKLLIAALIVAVLVSIYFIHAIFRKNKKYTRYKVIRKKIRVAIELTKNKLYFPDYLTLTITNTGSDDVDVDHPLMVFESLFMKRKFRLKGFDNYQFYPLYLEAGKVHTLKIDLGRFYQHDKRLRRFPKVTVYITAVKGKKLGRKSIMLRKTLFR